MTPTFTICGISWKAISKGENDSKSIVCYSEAYTQCTVGISYLET